MTKYPKTITVSFKHADAIATKIVALQNDLQATYEQLHELIAFAPEMDDSQE